MVCLIHNSLVAQIVVCKKTEKFVKLWIEAENGNLSSPMKVWDRNDASGGQYIEIQTGNYSEKHPPKDGHATYTFKVKKAGKYKVWGRVIAMMSDEDAFWVKMDDEEWIPWKRVSIGCKWHWDAVHDNNKNNQEMIYDLAEGTHNITFTYYVDDTKLDKILITNDLKLQPDEIGPVVEADIKLSNPTPTIDDLIYFDGSDSYSSETGIIKYEWDFGKGIIKSGVKVSHAFNQSGEHEVKLLVTDVLGLTGKISKSITVYELEPEVHFSIFPNFVKAGENITFDASKSLDANGNIVSYKWDYGDGSKGEGKKVNHNYKKDGAYPVTLTIRDNDENVKSITQLATMINGIPKKVIFETDMCLDVDDVGALAALHSLADNNEAEILAVCFNEVHPGGAGAIDTINKWYGRGEIPIGIYNKLLIEPDYSSYLDALANSSPPLLNNQSASKALEVYKTVLSEQEDESVTIISVGFLNNLDDLLNDSPDLVAKKVKELVIMGGIHNDGFNLSRHKLTNASENIFKNWPTPIVISQPGGSILTGPELEFTPIESPVREAYYQFFNKNFCKRPSWDQVAVLYGIRGVSDYFELGDDGFGELRNGYKWDMKKGFRTYLKTIHPNDHYSKIIEKLMIAQPKQKSK